MTWFTSDLLHHLVSNSKSVGQVLSLIVHPAVLNFLQHALSLIVVILSLQIIFHSPDNASPIGWEFDIGQESQYFSWPTYSEGEFQVGQEEDVTYLNLKDDQDFSQFKESFMNAIDKVFRDPSQNTGKNIPYIDRLKNADPDKWVAAFAPIAGEHLILEGAFQESISLMSIGKIVAYSYLVDIIGWEVHNYVGYSMTKFRYNDNKLDEQTGMPFNPFMNNGAIMVAYLLAREGKTIHDVIGFYQRSTNSPYASLDTDIYENYGKERDMELALNMLNHNSFPPPHDPASISTEELIEKAIDLYLNFCAINSTPKDLVEFGRTLAKGGTSKNGQLVIDPKSAKATVALMANSGLYDASKGFLYNYGLAAKSGVSGLLLTILPGVGALATYSSRLNDQGNSFRGITFVNEISQEFDLDIFIFDNSKTQLYFE